MKKPSIKSEILSEEAAHSDNTGRTSLYGAAVEYGIHCMVWLIEPRTKPVSSRDLAELQGVPTTLMARIMPRLEKAGLVVSTSGISGGYRLAKEPKDITVLDIADAIDGRKSVFDCKDIRKNCVLFGGEAPAWMNSWRMRRPRRHAARREKHAQRDGPYNPSRPVDGFQRSGSRGFWRGYRPVAG